MSHPTDDELVLYYYGESRQKAAIESHVHSCSACARAYDQLARTLATVTAPSGPEPPQRLATDVVTYVQNRVGSRSLSRRLARGHQAGTEASNAGMRSSRLVLLLPVVLAGLYPWLVLAFGKSILKVRYPSSTSWPILGIELVVGIFIVSAVPAVSFALGEALGRLEFPTPQQVRARRVSHLAFAAPSLLVAMGNVAGLIGLRSLVPVLWVAAWAGVGVLLQWAPAHGRFTLTQRSSVIQKTRVLHGVSAVGIFVVFLAPHLVNHVAGFWSGDAHLHVMDDLRPLYRSEVVEPLLIGAILVQMVSGLCLFLWRVRTRTRSIFDTLQTMSGVYLGIFLTSHMTAVFAARWSSVNTNWRWVVNSSGTILGNSPNVVILPHYFLGPLLVAIHVACGVRAILLEHAVSSETVDRTVGGLIALGVAASLVITTGLLGLHLVR